jgi:hypothetical protein
MALHETVGKCVNAMAFGRDMSGLSISLGRNITYKWLVEYADGGSVRLKNGCGTRGFTLREELSLASFLSLVEKLVAPKVAPAVSIGFSICPVVSNAATVTKKLRGMLKEGATEAAAVAVRTVVDESATSSSSNDDDGGEPQTTVFIDIPARTQQQTGNGEQLPSQLTASTASARASSSALPAPPPPASSSSVAAVASSSLAGPSVEKAPAAGNAVAPVRKQPSKDMLVINSRGSEKEKAAAQGRAVNGVMKTIAPARMAALEAAGRQLGVKAGATVEPTGELMGNCAYAALFRSSGSSFDSIKEEKAACSLTRKAVVASLAVNLLLPGSEGSAYRDVILASSLASDDSTAAPAVVTGSGKKGKKGGAGPAVDASAVPALSQEWNTAVAYLRGQLLLPASSAGGVGAAPTDSQYAGPSELSVLSSLLRRDLVVLAEQGSKDDGAVFLYEGDASGSNSSRSDETSPPLLPLVAVNTRRRHMYPLCLTLLGAYTSSSSSSSVTREGPFTAEAITMEQLEALAEEGKKALQLALREAEKAEGDDAVRATVSELIAKEILQAM